MFALFALRSACVAPEPLWDGGVRRLHADVPVEAATEEAAARRFLVDHGEQLGLTADPRRLISQHTGYIGTYFRFRQVHRGHEVFDTGAVVHVVPSRPGLLVRDVRWTEDAQPTASPVATIAQARPTRWCRSG